MVASGVAQRFDLFILTCLRIVFLTTHNTHNRQTDKHPCPGWDLNPQSQQAAEDLFIRPRGHWDWHLYTIWGTKKVYIYCSCMSGQTLPEILGPWGKLLTRNISDQRYTYKNWFKKQQYSKYINKIYTTEQCSGPIPLHIMGSNYNKNKVVNSAHNSNILSFQQSLI